MVGQGVVGFRGGWGQGMVESRDGLGQGVVGGLSCGGGHRVVGVKRVGSRGGGQDGKGCGWGLGVGSTSRSTQMKSTWTKSK